MREHFSINGDWLFRTFSGVVPPEVSLDAWHPGSVPGCVHLDLMAAGMIPDPFQMRNELAVQWVSEADWTYEREFEVPRSLLDHERLELVFEGLDTFASISLNGREIGRAQNMFIPHVFDAKEGLRAGENDVSVHFASPTKVLRSFGDKSGNLSAPFFSNRPYARKMQCSFGWDWAPCLPTSGIWRDAYVRAWDVARVAGYSVRVAEDVPADGRLIEVTVDVEAAHEVEVEVDVVLGEGLASGRMREKVPKGVRRLSCRMRAEDLGLWWPRGLGPQVLYDLRLALRSSRAELDSVVGRVGFRRIELAQCDPHGQPSFFFKVNGVPVFATGANWVPADAFLSRISEERYARLVEMAVGANLNMLRVWGGGCYESEAFYRLCDEHGIMVWQDFMFACAPYPESKEFVENVTREAELVVGRLRNHPCIAVWCGNNECIPSPGADGRVPEFSGRRIFFEILPEVCRRVDPDTPYWPGSPFEGAFPPEEAGKKAAGGRGDVHIWSVWSGWDDYAGYARCPGRFVSEYGFQAPPSIRTVEEFAGPLELAPQSMVVEHHNKQEGGPERLWRFLATHFRMPRSFEEFIYLCQLNQAWALKAGAENWRRRKFAMGGALYWQWNDCWPAVSWSVIDYALRPKAAWYYTRRFFAPVLVSMEYESGRLAIWLTNDRLEPVRGTLLFQHWDFAGKLINEVQAEAICDGNGCVVALETGFAPREPLAEFVCARLYEGSGLLSRNLLLFAEMKYIQLPLPRIHRSIEQVASNRMRLHLKTDVLAKDVCVELRELEAGLSDNYFDMFPAEEKTIDIELPSSMSGQELRERLTVEHLATMQPPLSWRPERCLIFRP